MSCVKWTSDLIVVLYCICRENRRGRQREREEKERGKKERRERERGEFSRDK